MEAKFDELIEPELDDLVEDELFTLLVIMWLLNVSSVSKVFLSWEAKLL